MIQKHISVLKEEAINSLNIKENGIYVDMTLGRAGHFLEILKKLNNTGLAIGIDQDSEAINDCKELLDSKKYKNFKLFKTNFCNIEKALSELNIQKVDGFLFDLGVSSPQFDEEDRGFSYRYDSRLDMRMDKEENNLTAYDVVNNYSLIDLTKIFKEYGEYKYSYSLAKEIVRQRKLKEIETTKELVDIIKSITPKKELEKKGHPAKQVFQALRIEVNKELDVLKDTLNLTLNHINIGGRIVVITFNSLEDRIVKNIFNSKSKVINNRYDLLNLENPDFSLVNKKVIVASSEELENNLRAKSAKLRAIERIK